MCSNTRIRSRIFRIPIAPYTPRHVAPPNLANTPRIDELMHDGKLYISMNDAVALALENNLDIAIARYNLNIADTDVWRAQVRLQHHARRQQRRRAEHARRWRGRSGHASRLRPGWNLGWRQAAPAQARRPGGIHLRQRPVITSFDPVLTGTLQLDHNNISLSQYFQPRSHRRIPPPANFAYQQGFAWGTNMSIGFNNTRQTFGNAPFTTLSPQL